MNSKRVEDEAGRPPILGWYSLSGREQAVWAARYAASVLPAEDAARDADRYVMALRDLRIDESRIAGPEHEAARGYAWMSFEEFASWYPTALKVSLRGKFEGADFSEPAVLAAFEAYKRSISDFS